jgi:hypothetical protein
MEKELVLSSAENISLYDLANGSLLFSFNIPQSAAHATAVIPTKNGRGGLLFSSEATKPILHVYSFQKVSNDFKFYNWLFILWSCAESTAA